jgi:hypothetical protein
VLVCIRRWVLWFEKFIFETIIELKYESDFSEGINLNTSIIISSIGFSGNLKTNNTVEIYNYLFNNTVGNIIGNLKD